MRNRLAHVLVFAPIPHTALAQAGIQVYLIPVRYDISCGGQFLESVGCEKKALVLLSKQGQWANGVLDVDFVLIPNKPGCAGVEVAMRPRGRT
jgi:hypothetical protein